MMHKAELIKGVIDGVYDKDEIIEYCTDLDRIKRLYAELLCTQQRLMNAEEAPFVAWGADAEFSEDESEFAKYIANHAKNPVTGEWEQLNHNYELERVEDAISIVEELMRKEPHQAEPHQAEPHQAETAPQKPQNKAGRRSRAFNSYLVGTDEEKERTLEKLHRLIDGRQGKEVALFIKVAVQLSLITKPTYTAVQKEFGDIGSKTNFNKYISQDLFTKEEIGGVYEQYITITDKITTTQAIKHLVQGKNQMSLEQMRIPPFVELNTKHTMTKKELNEIANEVAKQIIFRMKEVLTSDEVASYMGVSKSYIYKLTSQNRIPHYKPMGKVCYFNRLEIEKWLQSNRVSTDDEISQQAQTYCTKKGGVI